LIHGVAGWTSLSRSWDCPKPVPAHGLRNGEGGLGEPLTADIKQLESEFKLTHYGHMDEGRENAVLTRALFYCAQILWHVMVQRSPLMDCRKSVKTGSCVLQKLLCTQVYGPLLSGSGGSGLLAEILLGRAGRNELLGRNDIVHGLARRGEHSGVR